MELFEFPIALLLLHGLTPIWPFESIYVRFCNRFASPLSPMASTPKSPFKLKPIGFFITLLLLNGLIKVCLHESLYISLSNRLVRPIASTALSHGTIHHLEQHTSTKRVYAPIKSSAPKNTMPASRSSLESKISSQRPCRLFRMFFTHHQPTIR